MFSSEGNSDEGENESLLDDGRPQQMEIDVVHDKQIHEWDCGISCVTMVLNKDKRQEFVEEYDTILEAEGIKTSIWTIDLAYLLKRLDVQYKYYTTTLGVDPSYQKKAYYKGVINRDQDRVVEKFERAADNGVSVTQRSISLDEIISHIAKNNLAIVLVDSTKIVCQAHCTHKEEIWSSHFVGHYLVLCGYDLPARVFLYRNPIYSSGVCKITFDTFERARKSHGTDQDIILLNTNPT